MPTGAKEEEVRKADKAFSAVIRSLGDIVTASLPSNLKDPFDPKSVALWKHVMTLPGHDRLSDKDFRLDY